MSASPDAAKQSRASVQRGRPEAGIQAAIVAAIGCEHDFRVFRNNVGVAQFGRAKVRYGLCVGSSDLIGILSPSGRLVSLEVKSATGRSTEEQRKWLAMVRRMGGFGCIVRSVHDARAALQRAREGASE